MVQFSRLRRICGWLGLLACLYLVSEDREILQAQVQPGMIQGTVTTSTGEALPGVSVMIRSSIFTEEPQYQITSAFGRFRFLSLPPSRYEIIIELEGFSTLHYSFDITPGCFTSVELSLERNIEDYPIGSDVPPPQSTSSVSLWDSYR